MKRKGYLASAVSIVVLAAALSASGGVAQDGSPEPSPAASPAAPVDAGPLTGDQSLFDAEQQCISEYANDHSNPYRNYWPAIGAPEHTDAYHSGLQPCASFTGSFDGANQVFQHTSDETYSLLNFMVFDGPSGAYLLGDGSTGGTPPEGFAGTYIAKFDPASGDQLWKTQLQNINTSGQWSAFGSVAIHKNGYILAAAGPTIFKIDRDTGAIVASVEQPILDGGAENANFDGFAVAPDHKGTILLKTQNRSAGCPDEGNAAMMSCVADYGPVPNSTVIAADPDTLENIAAIELDQSVTARPIIVEHDKKIYMYLAGNTTLLRVIWDPKAGTLTQDPDWVVEYLLDGQTGGPAPAVLGDWIISSANAAGGSVPQTITAVSQDDPTKIVQINPWGETLPDGVPASETPASVGIDADNSMIFAQDWLVGGVFGISLDQDSGAMEVAWSRPDWRNSDYFSLVGPADQRVLISQYINPADFSAESVQAGLTYTEGVLWANALTGETIAQSGYNASTALGSLPNLGYGGRLYMMGNAGKVFIYQVEPASADG
jgi:hypothetical protein